MKNLMKKILFALAIFVAGSLVLAGRASAAPVVQTLSATNINNNTVTLNGLLNPQGENATYWFEYGTSYGLGQSTSQQNAGSVNAQINVYNTIYGGLNPNTTYYYRIVAQSPSGFVQGQILTFTSYGNGTGGPYIPYDPNYPYPPYNPYNGQAPVVSTNAPLTVGTNSAVLRAQVNPNNSLSSVWFEYGRTSALGGVTTRDPAGSGTTATDYSVTLNGLAQGATYYYRAVATNQYGTTRGQMLTLVTSGNSTGRTARPATTPRTTTTGGGTTPTTPTTPANDPLPTNGPVGAPGCFQVGPMISSPQLKPSDDFTYSVTYRNNCGTVLQNASLQITLPLAVDFASTNHEFVSRDANVITYNLGTIAANFQNVVSVTGKVKAQVNNGDSLIFQADLSYADGRGVRQTTNGYLTATILLDAVPSVAGASTSTNLGASTADALGNLFHSGWFWLVLCLILIALFVFWLATRRRGDEEAEEEEEAHGH